MALVRSKLSTEFDVSLLELPITLEGVWSFIRERELDALIVDFQLFDSGKVSFDGNDVVKAITAHNEHFPIIVLTAHENRALDELENVLIIKGKKLINDSEALPVFVKMLKALIQSYKSKVEDCQQILLELQKKETLTEEEESKLFRAQQFLAEIAKDGAVPSNLFSIGYSRQLQGLLDTANSLLFKLNQ